MEIEALRGWLIALLVSNIVLLAAMIFFRMLYGHFPVSPSQREIILIMENSSGDDKPWQPQPTPSA